MKSSNESLGLYLIGKFEFWNFQGPRLLQYLEKPASNRVKPQIMSYPAPSTELDKKVLDPHVTPTTNLQNDQDFKD